jgi:hypothetical protein
LPIRPSEGISTFDDEMKVKDKESLRDRKIKLWKKVYGQKHNLGVEFGRRQLLSSKWYGCWSSKIPPDWDTKISARMDILKEAPFSMIKT